MARSATVLNVLPFIALCFFLSLTSSNLSLHEGAKDLACNVGINVTDKWTECYPEKCVCTKYIADCSGKFQTLTFIPKVPHTIQFLNFSSNNVVTVAKDFFRNITKLTALSLSNCRIVYIHPDAFRRLKLLKVLFLDHNFNMTTFTLLPVFQAKSLTCLDIRYGNITTLPDVMFHADAMPNLEGLLLHANNIRLANLTLFQNLPKLSTLAWDMNNVYILHTDFLSALHDFDLLGNMLVEFPETCAKDGKSSLFPNLEWLRLMKNKIDKIPDMICLPKLVFLDLGGNYFPTLYSDMFHPRLFPMLAYLHLEYIGTAVVSIKNNTFNNPNLLVVSLMYNNIDFSVSGQYSDESFAGCPNLAALQISHNFLTDVSDDHFRTLFGNLTKLETLYMGGTGFQRITKRTFSSFPNLKVLMLYQNKVPVIPDGAFDSNPLLYELRLDDNRITTIRESTFSESLRQQMSFLDFSGNPFTCDCSLRWFSDWLRHNKNVFGQSMGTYNCSNLNDYPVDSFHMTDQACIFSTSTHQIIIAAASFFIIVAVIVSLLFRYQWVLRLRLYEVFRGPSDVRRRIIQTGNFDFDVFVCYSSGDKTWVVDHLMPELEGRLKLKLCIHERDFVVGKHIVDNIVECVEHSKKILIIFSKDFILSSWCQFELAVCLQHAIDCDDSLIAVCLDDVATRDLSSPMKAVLSTMTYIQWNSSLNLNFWERVEKAFEDIISVNVSPT